MFKNNGPEVRMETLESIRARMAAYDDLPIGIRARLQTTGDDLHSIEYEANSIQALLAFDDEKITEAA
jgi:hypothetical protein